MTTAEAGTSAPLGQTQPYRVLARKYRPATFAQLIGQEAMVRTLGNALRSGRLAHAYMLSGVRGVGKTTTARIIARALNCVGLDGAGGPTPEPCGVCTHCVAIAQDRHLDVIEMDAASRTKVEEIRELLDGVPYRPTSARYKVYIVDEVHMLSTHSFNALLKTLEEPPEHVKFIFATTEIRKVPVTVLSRCQRFDLRRVDTAEIARHLQRVATAETVSASEGALNLIARAADGSVRDGLSLLDQAIALGAGQIDETVVREMLGLVDRTVVFDLFDALMQGEVACALEILGGRYAAGADPAAVLEDLLELTHWITRIKVVPAAAAAPGVAEAERVRGGAMAEKLDMAEVTRVWQMLLKGLGETRVAPVPIQAAEMVLIRIAYAARLPTPADAIESLSRGTSPSSPMPTRPVSSPPPGRPRAGDPQ
ncbi:MAG: DNA polymerase III subunit gamma/tau, partial [Defluviicoccus sp.]